MTQGRNTDNQPASIVHGNALTLDFTTRPTRASFGFAADRNYRSYQRSGPMLQTKAVLPGGTIVIPAFDVTAASDAAGGAQDKNYTHTPKWFDISRTFDDAESARTSLLADASILGLSAAEIEQVLPQVGTGVVVPQQRVLHGLVDDWLSLDVELSDGDNGDVTAQYVIQIDYFHNAAIDKVVSDGRFALDLTRRPDRADVGMLDGYSDSYIQPPWGQTLTFALTLPGGSLEQPLTSAASTSARSADDSAADSAAPVSTVFSVADSSVAAVERDALAAAPLLGVDPVAVQSIFAAPAGQRVTKTLAGTSTAAYDVTMKLDVTPGQAGNFAASLKYTFTYH